MSRQKAAGSRGDTALSAIKRYVGGGDCYHQFPRMSLLGFSVNRGLYLATIRKLLQQTLLGVIIGSLERTYRGRGGSPMSSLNLVRWGAIAFIVGGVVWLLVGFLDATTGPFIPPGSVAPLLLIVALLLLALGLVGLHALQGESYGRIGLAGLYTALAAIAAQVLGWFVLLAGSTALGWLVSLGPLATLVGLVLYGAATVQAR